jgi:hypothetical protein
VDLSAGTSTTALSGELDDEDEAFTSSAAPAAVVGGHTYRLSIDTVTAQSTAAFSLLSGTASLRFVEPVANGRARVRSPTGSSSRCSAGPAT